MTEFKKVRMWLVFSVPAWVGSAYLARLYISKGDDMVPTSKVMKSSKIEVLRSAFTKIGCSVRPEQIGEVIEIWVEPDDEIKLEISG